MSQKKTLNWEGVEWTFRRTVVGMNECDGCENDGVDLSLYTGVDPRGEILRAYWCADCAAMAALDD